MEHLKGDGARRKPLATPHCLAADGLYLRAAALGVVEYEAGVGAARLAIGRKQRLEAHSKIAHLGISVGHGARWAYCRAAAAAGTQVRLDLDVIAVGADRAGRADLEAAVAALDARAGVGADLFAVGEKARLLELAHQLRQFRRGERLRERIGPGREVALRQVGHAQQRLRREIEHQVEAFLARAFRAREIDGADLAAGRHALAMGLAFPEVDLVAEVDRVLGADVDALVAARAHVEVDRVFLQPLDFEGAEPARDAQRLPGPHREAALSGKLAALHPCNEGAGLKIGGKPLCPFQSCPGGPDHQDLAAGLVLDVGHRLGLGQRRGGQQRGDFRRRLPAFGRPARHLPDVDEAQLGLGPRRLGELAEERRLLRAAHQERLVAERRLELSRLLAAQLGVDGERGSRFQRRRQGLRIERDGLVAAAQLKRPVFYRHGSRSVQPLLLPLQVFLPLV